MLPRRWNRLGGRLLLAFLLIVAVNLAAIATIQVFQHRLVRSGEQREIDHAIESKIEAYLDAIQELSRGLFMLASGQSDMGRALVLEAEGRLSILEAELAGIPWESSVITFAELAPCLAIRDDLSAEARKSLALVSALDLQSSSLLPSQRAEMRSALEISLNTATMLAEHTHLYVVELVDELRAHTQRNLARNAQLTRWTITITIAAASLSLGFAVVVSLLFARSLVRRLAALGRTVQAFGRGDLAQRIHERREDELGELGRAFDHMADAIQAQDALRLSKEYVDNIVDTMANALVVLDENAVIEKVNRATCRLLGYREDELVGTSAERIFGMFPETMRAPAPWRSGSAENVEIAVVTRDGETRTASFSSATMTDRQGTKVVCMLEDITERKQLILALVEAKRAAESATKAKTAFLANMSHELRTPLNAILGYAQVLAGERDLSDRQRDAVTTMRTSGEHLARLLEDLLDISKIEAERMEIHPSDIHLGRFLDDLLAPFRMRAEHKGLLFRYEVLSDLPEAVRADDRRLRQVLINLLGNAIKFTEHGSVSFRVGRHEGRVRFEVADTGAGIAPEILDDIFAPFRQGGPPQHLVEGTGLGLAISKRLVELMGGEIGVDSTPGQGSVFWVDLDLPAADGWQAAPGFDAQVSGYEGPRRRVLIVDDQPENRELLARCLAPFGFDVHESGDGREALVRVSNAPPDVILMDLRMPEMDGLAATRALRAMPEGRDVTIIAVSASAFHGDREGSLKAGCDGFLAKPIRLEALLALLGALLDLTWIHSSSRVEVASGPHDAASGPYETPAWTGGAPPAGELGALLAAAREGDIKALRAEIDRIEALDPSHAAFTAELRALAKQYRLKQIRALLEARVE